MKLLDFQVEAVTDCINFIDTIEKLKTAFPQHRNLAGMAWESLNMTAKSGRAYSPVIDSSGNSIPCMSIVIPTGGGKTITGISAGIEIILRQNTASKVLIWLVPSDTIYRQVLKAMGENGWLTRFVSETYGLDLNRKTLESYWSEDDFRPDVLSVVVATYQSLVGDSGRLRFYRSSDLVSALPIWDDGNQQPSLHALFEKLQPVIVLDEAHRTYTKNARNLFTNSSLASALLELTATPKPYSQEAYPNVLVNVPAAQLIENQLLKTPIRYYCNNSGSLSVVLKELISLQHKLEKRARLNGSPFVPKVLISSEFTDESKKENEYSAHNIRDVLIALGVRDSRVVMKSASVDQLGDQDLDNPDSDIAFVISKTALVEGWDVKSVYVVALLNNIGATQTTFQIVGRGLRQPNARYFEDQHLNSLHVYTNSLTQDQALSQIKTFMENEGLFGSISLVAGEANGSVKIKVIDRFEMPILVAPKDVSNYETEFATKLGSLIDIPLEVDFIFRNVPNGEQLFVVNLDGKSESSNATAFSKSHSIDQSDWIQSLFKTSLKELTPILNNSLAVLKFLNSQLNGWRSSPDYEQLFEYKPSLVSRALALYVTEQIGLLHRELFIGTLFPQYKLKKGTIPEEKVEDFVFNCTKDSPGTIPFRNSMFGDFPKGALNSEELDFARWMDSVNLDWARNFAQAGYFQIPTPNGNIYPDFLIALKNEKQELGHKYLVVETKGDHLIGSVDSEFKKLILENLETASAGRLIGVFGNFSAVKEALSKFID